jgi:hypothetical protein
MASSEPRQDEKNPVRQLAAEMEWLRAAIRGQKSAVGGTVLQRRPTEPRPLPIPVPMPMASDAKIPRGRSQVAGSGQAAWRTVLDTHTGVIQNYRTVGGHNLWMAITTPVLARDRQDPDRR